MSHFPHFKIIRFLLFLFVVSCFSSCVTYHKYYIQNVQQVPLFKGKNEFRLSGHIGGASKFSVKDVQAAYAITDHIAVMGEGMFMKMHKKSTQEDWAKGSYVEGAIGYYKDLEKKGLFEVYAGFGTCEQHHFYTEDVFYDDALFFIPVYETVYRGEAQLSFNRFFIQPSYGFSFDNWDAALSLRVSDVYYNYINNQIDPSFRAGREIEIIREGRNSIMLEPALTMRGGWKYVKVQLQYGYSFNVNNPNIKMERNNFTVGFQFHFANRFRKAKTVGLI